ncbi:MAG: ATP-binding protein [Deltaproteobacteria bacterium]|nr:ATP-binding protein [Deltaproteobacteria bacterium]
MRFVAGPRQVGKTTLARSFLESKKSGIFYYNWDQRTLRTHFKKDPHFFHSDVLKEKKQGETWICFDEIHKYPKWKNILKDLFDSFEDRYHFIVTGSARLDLFRRSGDSLSGRYFLFRLLPISLFEMEGRPLDLPDTDAKTFIEKNIQDREHASDLEQLLQFGGFPEPLFKANEVFSSHWREEYLESLLKEDLRDLTKIHELENVASFLSLLPERVGSPLSLNAVRENLEVSYTATKNYLQAAFFTYILFQVPPYTQKISRSLKKEKKIYFFDWTNVTDPSKRFENYVAVELKNRVDLWTSATKYKFDLFFVRSRDGRETDFLVTRDAKPYFLVEAKLSSDQIESHNRHHAVVLGNIPLIQLIAKQGVVKAGRDNTYLLSASRFL